MLPGPFLACMGTLMFLLIMQFLMRYLPDLVGKGLPLTVILELIVYNLAYMVVLAVPMSMLIATTMACGRLAESQAYTVIKNAGISFPRLIWPVLLVGGFLMLGMFYFNNIVLPEANYRAKNLWIDIRRKKPGVELEAGTFYTGLPGYSIRAEAIDPESNLLHDLLIFDETGPNNTKTTILARRGTLRTRQRGQLLELILLKGELHRLQKSGAPSQYEQLTFQRHKIQFDISDFSFNRQTAGRSTRSDRTMPTTEMLDHVDSLYQIADKKAQQVHAQTRQLAAFTTNTTSLAATEVDSSRSINSFPFALHHLDRQKWRRLYGAALQQARDYRSDLEGTQNTVKWYRQQANRYLVEVHKKLSIAVACVIFVLIGAPLGLAVQRGSISIAGGLSAGIFLFYWITLVQGEKMADRGLLDPWVGMWAANLVVGIGGIILSILLTLDRTSPQTVQHLLYKIRSLIRQL